MFIRFCKARNLIIDYILIKSWKIWIYDTRRRKFSVSNCFSKLVQCHIHLVFETTVRNCNTQEVFDTGDWIYTDSSCLLIAWLRREEKSFGNRETLSRHRQIMSESWYFCAWRKFADRNRQDFRFTLYRDRRLVLGNPANFRGWSSRCIFKVIPYIFGA